MSEFMTAKKEEQDDMTADETKREADNFRFKYEREQDIF